MGSVLHKWFASCLWTIDGVIHYFFTGRKCQSYIEFVFIQGFPDLCSCFLRENFVPLEYYMTYKSYPVTLYRFKRWGIFQVLLSVKCWHLLYCIFAWFRWWETLATIAHFSNFNFIFQKGLLRLILHSAFCFWLAILWYNLLTLKYTHLMYRSPCNQYHSDIQSISIASEKHLTPFPSIYSLLQPQEITDSFSVVILEFIHIKATWAFLYKVSFTRTNAFEILPCHCIYL